MPHLHQTRVGIRRLRSSFSLFRPLLRDVPGRSSTRPIGCARSPCRSAPPATSTCCSPARLVDDLDGDQVRHGSRDRGREAAYDGVLAILRSKRWADAERPRRARRPRAVAGCRRRRARARPCRAGAGEAVAAGRRPCTIARRDVTCRAASGAHRGQEAALRLRVLRRPVRRRARPAVVTDDGERAQPGPSRTPGTSSRCRPPSARSTTTPPPTRCCARWGPAAPAVDEAPPGRGGRGGAVHRLAAVEPFWR